MVSLYRDTMGLPLIVEDVGVFAMFSLPDGARIEVFGPGSQANTHFSSAPVVGFLVDDVDLARPELEAAGAEFVFSGSDGLVAWAHYRATDGNLYEITHDQRPG